MHHGVFSDHISQDTHRSQLPSPALTFLWILLTVNLASPALLTLLWILLTVNLASPALLTFLWILLTVNLASTALLTFLWILDTVNLASPAVTFLRIILTVCVTAFPPLCRSWSTIRRVIPSWLAVST